MADDNRRKSTRVYFQTTANLHFDDADFTNCETADLSIKGVFVMGISGRAIGDPAAGQRFLVDRRPRQGFCPNDERGIESQA